MKINAVDVIIILAVIMAIEVAGDYFRINFPLLDPTLVFYGAIAIIIGGIIYKIKIQ